MATKKEAQELSQNALMDYFKLSKLLFTEDAPNDINELAPGNQFYQTAKEIAEEMGLDWDKMSHDDSNRVMLNLLAEYYAAIRTDEDYKPVLIIKLEKEK